MTDSSEGNRCTRETDDSHDKSGESTEITSLSTPSKGTISEGKDPALVPRIDDEELSSKLKSVGLDNEYWPNILKTECGLTSSCQLKFTDTTDLDKLEKFARYPWEVHALANLLNIKKKKKNDYEEMREEKKKETLKREENSNKLLDEIKVLTTEGKTRLDGSVKEKEKELRDALNIPDEVWITAHADKNIDDIIKGVSEHLGEVKQLTVDREELSTKSLLDKASGGLVLKGVLLRQNMAVDIPEVGRTVIEAPDSVVLKHPTSAPEEYVQEFSSQELNDKFHKVAEILGYSMACGLKGGIFGAQVQIGPSQSKGETHENSSENHANKETFSREKHSFFPMAMCELELKNLKFSDDALRELKELETMVGGTEKESFIQKECEGFLKKYGSHVNCGRIEFGGIYEWKANYESNDSTKKKVDKDIVSKELDCYVSMSYCHSTMWNIGASIGGGKSKGKSTLDNAHEKIKTSESSLHVSRKGGSPEASSLTLWKESLIRGNSTWAVIDRGNSIDRDFIGIWELIRRNPNHFCNAEQFAKSLHFAWMKMNGMSQEALRECLSVKDAIGSMHKLCKKFPEWNMDEKLHQNALHYLQNLLKQVRQCCSSIGDNKLWCDILETDTRLHEFLEHVMNIQSQYSTSDLSFIKYNLHKIRESASGCEFPLAAKIYSWVDFKNEFPNEKEYVPQMMIGNNICDIPSFLNAIKESILLGMVSSAEPGDISHQINSQATKDLSLAVLDLHEKLSTSASRHEQFILSATLLGVGFDPTTMTFDALIRREDLKEFTNSLWTCWQDYLGFRASGDEQSRKLQAVLLHFPVLSLYQIDWRLRVQRFKDVIKIIKDELHPELEALIERYTYSSTLDLIGLGSALDEIKSEKASKDITTGSSLHHILDRPCLELPNDIDARLISANPDAKCLLDLLHLTDFYPSKITSGDVMSIKKRRSLQDIEPKHLPWLILQKICMADSRGREADLQNIDSRNHEIDDIEKGDNLFAKFLKDITPKKDEKSILNPLDVFIALFVCCDLILKQTLLQKMFLCRLAVPLIYPQMSDEILLYSLWALRSIIVDCKVNKHVCTESSVVCYPTKIVSFLQVGKPTVSKSDLLNNVISDQPHHTFWNRECPLGETKIKLADGLVETQWYLPRGKSDDLFDDVTMFLNLRGDARTHTRQTQIMEKVSNVVVCCVDMSNLREEGTRGVMKGIHSKSSNVVLLLTKTQQTKLNAQEELADYFSYTGNMENAKVIAGFRGDMSNTTAEIKIELRKAINLLLDKQSGMTIKDVSTEAEKLGVEIDENEHFCEMGNALACKVISCLENEQKHKCKSEMLPLQGQYWERWGRLQKEENSVGARHMESSTLHELSKIQREMEVIREEQFQVCQHLSPLMTAFLSHLLDVKDSHVLIFYVKWLKIYFNEMSRKILPNIQQEYHDKWRAIKLAGYNGQGSPNISAMKNSLSDIEKTFVESSFGFEHLVRELGQIYEAVKDTEPESMIAILDGLPSIAAKMLIQGEAIEIMNGDTANVPLNWVKAVLKALSKQVGNKKLFVISVLGIQSSGKSTLLNTMFGLQFAVSAGRCTRGVYMQLIKVDETRRDLPYNYIFVVDTEGLRAPELGDQKLDNDNQLATFVIGLGDVTILNIKGESLSEISDILQIVVHAFLRMKLSKDNTQMYRSCYFIHQNVPAANAMAKMQHGTKMLQEKLDAMTKEACGMENIVHIHSFNQVIRFDGDTNVWHFSDLWSGDPPMAPVNPGYSEKAHQVREYVLKDPKVQKQTFLTFSDLSCHLEDLWRAILTENFVFSFRNSLAAKAYSSLEKTYQEKTWDVEKHLAEWQLKSASVVLQRCTTVEAIEKEYACLLNDLIQITNELKEKVISEFECFFESHDLKDILIEWKVDKLAGLHIKMGFLCQMAKQKLNQRKEEVRTELLHKAKTEGIDIQVMARARYYANELKGQRPADNKLRTMFDKFWTTTVSELTQNAPEVSMPIEETLEECLHSHLHDCHSTLNQELKKKPLQNNVSDAEYSMTIKDIHNHDLSISESLLAKLGGKGEIVQCKHKALDTIKDILNAISIYLADVSKQDSPFQREFGTHIVTTVIKKVEDYNIQSKANETFTLRSDLIVKIAVQACHLGVRVFREMDRSYKFKHSICKQVNDKRDAAFSLFQNTVSQRTDEVIAADLFMAQLEVIVEQAAQKRMRLKIVDEMVHFFGFQKYNLLLKILGDLVDKGFPEYRLFLSNPYAFALQSITEYTKKEIFEGSTRNISKYEMFALAGIDELSQDIEKGIRLSADLINKESSPDIKTWVKHFCTLVKNLPVTVELLKDIAEQSVTDFENFEQLLLERLLVMGNRVYKAFKDISLESMRWEDKTPYKQILDRLWGCDAQCPFCGEVCQRTNPNHISPNDPHLCIQHRQPGIMGNRWVSKDIKERTLVIESCSYLVQTDVVFLSGVSRMQCRKNGNCKGNKDTTFPYRQYKTFLPDWDIAPSPNMESSKYWMWVMATYKKELAFAHSAKVPDIPSAWHGITKQEALDSLRVANG